MCALTLLTRAEFLRHRKAALWLTHYLLPSTAASLLRRERSSENLVPTPTAFKDMANSRLSWLIYSVYAP
jgi:hypothetical protein